MDWQYLCQSGNSFAFRRLRLYFLWHKWGFVASGFGLFGWDSCQLFSCTAHQQSPRSCTSRWPFRWLVGLLEWCCRSKCNIGSCPEIGGVCACLPTVSTTSPCVRARCGQAERSSFGNRTPSRYPSFWHFSGWWRGAGFNAFCASVASRWRLGWWPAIGVDGTLA